MSAPGLSGSFRLGLVVAVLGLAACSKAPHAPGECAANSECASGEVCNQAHCVPLCNVDFDCHTGLICRDSLCIEGSRDRPVIEIVDGDGVADCVTFPAAAPTGHDCIATGLKLTGTNLEGASIRLVRSGTEVFELDPRPGSTDEAVAVDLPRDITPGPYTLTAVNGAGTAEQAVELIAGPPGPTLDPDPLIEHINHATMTTFVIGVLPVGTSASQVARGDHLHDADYLRLTGGTISGDLAVTGELRQTGYLQTASGSPTATYEYSGRRYVIDLTASQVGVVQTLDWPLTQALCEDLDGCSVTIAMSNWNATETICSRREMLFINPTSHRWRFSNDIEATDDDGSVNNQEWCGWDCCITDAETSTSTSNDRVDNLPGFGVYDTRGGNENDANTRCRFIIED